MKLILYSSLRSLLILATAACCCFSPHLEAVTLSLGHQYGEFVDRGNVSVWLQVSDNSRLDCNVPVSIERNANSITVTARKVPGTLTQGDSCTYSTHGDLGNLAAGGYLVTAKLLSVDGNSFETQSTSVQILPLVGRCNAIPEIHSKLIVLHNSLSWQQLAQRIASDPIYALRLGNPVVTGGSSFDNYQYAYLDYPPLEDVTVKIDLLTQTGEFRWIGRNVYLCFTTPPGDAIADVVEFYNAIADQFFYTASTAELQSIDSGLMGTGWSRTGKSFRAVTYPGCQYLFGGTRVYRFNGVPNVGPVSHFFTRSREECYAVDASKAWTYEGVAFWAGPVNADGTCSSADQVPLHRMLRVTGETRHRRILRITAETRHRYTIDRAIVDDMVAKGWIYEGPVMCVLAPAAS